MNRTPTRRASSSGTTRTAAWKARCGPGNYKLKYFYTSGEARLYDLNEDIGESTDLAAAKPEVTARLKRELAAWLQRVDAQFPEGVQGPK